VAETRKEWVTRMIEIWNARHFEEFLDELGPDVEFSPDPSFPDAGTYRGEGFRRWMRDWIATWQENRFEMFEATEVGQGLLVRGRWHLASKGSGESVPLADFTVVYLFSEEEGNQPDRMAVFFDHDQAIAMARGTG
jgi:hypothetical protein